MDQAGRQATPPFGSYDSADVRVLKVYAADRDAEWSFDRSKAMLLSAYNNTFPKKQHLIFTKP